MSINKLPSTSHSHQWILRLLAVSFRHTVRVLVEIAIYWPYLFETTRSCHNLLCSGETAADDWCDSRAGGYCLPVSISDASVSRRDARPQINCISTTTDRLALYEMEQALGALPNNLNFCKTKSYQVHSLFFHLLTLPTSMFAAGSSGKLIEKFKLGYKPANLRPF